MPAPLTYTAFCSAGTCVKLEEDADLGGYIATSTIDGNDGAVFYTYGEFVQFATDVKAGKLDHLIQNATDKALLTA